MNHAVKRKPAIYGEEYRDVIRRTAVEGFLEGFLGFGLVEIDLSPRKKPFASG